MGTVDDLEDLRKSSTAHISPKGWRKILLVKQSAKTTLRELQNDFKTVSVSGFDKILAKHSGADVKLVQQIEVLLKDEAHYEVTDYFTLKSIQTSYYISTKNKQGYPRLDAVAPIALQFVSVNGTQHELLYGEHVMITAKQYPNQYLCMNRHDYYPKFQDLPGIEKSRCQYRLVGHKKFLQFGDDVLLYNEYWKDYILGEKGEWLACIKAENSDDYRHHFYMGKTNF